MKLLTILIALPLIAAEPPKLTFTPAATPKMGEASMRTMDLLAQLHAMTDNYAKAQKATLELQQRLLIVQECWEKGVRPADCSPQADGSLVKPAAPAPAGNQ